MSGRNKDTSKVNTAKITTLKIPFIFNIFSLKTYRLVFKKVSFINIY